MRIWVGCGRLSGPIKEILFRVAERLEMECHAGREPADPGAGIAFRARLQVPNRFRRGRCRDRAPAGRGRPGGNRATFR